MLAGFFLALGPLLALALGYLLGLCRTRTRTNTNPNDTEANAAGRSGSARALRKTKQVLNNSRGGGALAKSLAKSEVFVGVVHSARQQRGRRASKDAQELLPRPRSGSE